MNVEVSEDSDIEREGTEGRGQMTDDRGQKAEVGSLGSVIRSQKSENKGKDSGIFGFGLRLILLRRRRRGCCRIRL